MNHSIGRPRFDRHPRLGAALSIAAGFAALTVVVLFAWNSFAATVLGLTELDFRQALGLTLLLAAAGRLLSDGRLHGRRLREISE
jgi:hypothetical protein